jgi:DNA-directed RNA polymerase subunit L
MTSKQTKNQSQSKLKDKKDITYKSSKIDINVKELKYIKAHKFISSKLVLDIDGKDMDFVISNTLRRIAYDDVPTYAFVHVNIGHNNSKLNNDYMKIRLKQLPIYDISNEFDFVNPKYYQNVDYSAIDLERPEGEQKIEFILTYHNNSNELINVTTNEGVYLIDGQKTPYPNRNPEEPILIIQLHPNETFKCHLKAYIGIGEANNIWSGCVIAHHEYEPSDRQKVKFTIESTGQISEYDLLIKCCKVALFKFNCIKSEIIDKINTKEISEGTTIYIQLANEDHTVGNLITHFLQEHNDIIFAGYSKPDQLIKSIFLKIACKNTLSSPINALFDVIDHITNVFSHLFNTFVQMSK